MMIRSLVGMFRAAFCFLFCLLFCTEAHAQADDAAKNAARAMGEEGIRLYDGGQYEDALDRFVRADALVPVPTLNLRAGQCLEKLHRLVEASERYLRAAMLAVDTNAPRAYQDAQGAAKDEAARARTTLLPRIAHVRIVAVGARTLVIDGKNYPVALLGTSIPLDPGPHLLVVSGVPRDVDLGEGAEQALEIAVPPDEARPVDGAREHTAPVVPTNRTAAWFVGGAGVAALGVGIVSGVMVFADKSASDAECPSKVVCTPRGANLMRDAQALAWVANIGVGLGVVGLATSVVLLVLAKPAQAQARMTPWFNGVGVIGTF